MIFTKNNRNFNGLFFLNNPNVHLFVKSTMHLVTLVGSYLREITWIYVYAFYTFTVYVVMSAAWKYLLFANIVLHYIFCQQNYPNISTCARKLFLTNIYNMYAKKQWKFRTANLFTWEINSYTVYSRAYKIQVSIN